jgi:hypothetical protein
MTDSAATLKLEINGGAASGYNTLGNIPLIPSNLVKLDKANSAYASAAALAAQSKLYAVQIPGRYGSITSSYSNDLGSCSFTSNLYDKPSPYP